jgi:hypothetical protein
MTLSAVAAMEWLLFSLHPTNCTRKLRACLGRAARGDG